MPPHSQLSLSVSDSVFTLQSLRSGCFIPRPYGVPPVESGLQSISPPGDSSMKTGRPHIAARRVCARRTGQAFLSKCQAPGSAVLASRLLFCPAFSPLPPGGRAALVLRSGARAVADRLAVLLRDRRGVLRTDMPALVVAARMFTTPPSHAAICRARPSKGVCDGVMPSRARDARGQSREVVVVDATP